MSRCTAESLAPDTARCEQSSISVLGSLGSSQLPTSKGKSSAARASFLLRANAAAAFATAKRGPGEAVVLKADADADEAVAAEEAVGVDVPCEEPFVPPALREEALGEVRPRSDSAATVEKDEFRTRARGREGRLV